MAAIDKLYVHSYDEYEELRQWAVIYYPKLLFYFYDTNLIYNQYRSWLLNKNNTSKKEYTILVMNAPSRVDRKLKWICPVPCVREYLHKQCGVNPKWEWLYKIFWRGKKYF